VSAAVASSRHDLGVDRAIPIQYVRFVGWALLGDLGISFERACAYLAGASGDPVGPMVLRAAVVTAVTGPRRRSMLGRLV
jgi:ABC-type dipeptide/oligopeptide/nickel transport system permease component